MPKIGMPSSAMMTVRWLNPLRVAVENGFDAYEINCSYPSAEVENTPPEVFEKANKILEKSGIPVSRQLP